MNLTRIIEETGKRLRRGKIYSERLTNAQIKQVLEMAVEVMKESLIEEGHIEIQNFAVIEVVRSEVKNPNTLRTRDKRGEIVERRVSSRRVRWVIKPSKALREHVKKPKPAP